MRDIKSRYKQSLLGYTWAVANPFIWAVVFTIVGKQILGFKEQAMGLPYTVFAYYGLLFWNIFASGLSSATESLVGNLSLITKVYFPREVFPISAVLGKMVDFGFGLLGLLPLLIYFHQPISWRIVMIVPLLAITLVFTMGIGFLAACANLFYRDVRQIIALVVSVLVFFVPNMYPLELVHQGSMRTLYLLNPMATVIETARRASFPHAGSAVALLPFVGYAAITSVVVFVIGFLAFKHYESRFAEFI